MSNENIRTIEVYIDSLAGSDHRNSAFVDRLDSVRSIIADEGYPEGAEAAVEAFLALDPATRVALIRRLRVRNQALDWARESQDDEAIQSLAADLEALAGSEN